MPRSRSRSHRRGRKGRRPSSSSSSSRSSGHSHRRSHSRDHKDEGRKGRKSQLDKIYKSPFTSGEIVISSVLAGPALTKMIAAVFSAVADIDKSKVIKTREDVGNTKLLVQPPTLQSP